MTTPRVRVAALIHWQNRILLCRQEKPGREYWLLPGGGVDGGETLVGALRRELSEELGLRDSFPLGEDSYVLRPWVIEGKPLGRKTEEMLTNAPPAAVDR